jgi:hypothetical protein
MLYMGDLAGIGDSIGVGWIMRATASDDSDPSGLGIAGQVQEARPLTSGIRVPDVGERILTSCVGLNGSNLVVVGTRKPELGQVSRQGTAVGGRKYLVHRLGGLRSSHGVDARFWNLAGARFEAPEEEFPTTRAM